MNDDDNKIWQRLGFDGSSMTKRRFQKDSFQDLTSIDSTANQNTNRQCTRTTKNNVKSYHGDSQQKNKIFYTSRAI